MRPGVPRTCLKCGKLLPEGSSNSRQYCDQCAYERNLELTRERMKELNQKSVDAAAQKQTAKDRAYCHKCIYGNKHNDDYLCNYIMRTGHQRGCKPGEGCTMRVLGEPLVERRFFI